MDELIYKQDVIKIIHKFMLEEIEKTPLKIDEDGYEIYADTKAVNNLLRLNKNLSKLIMSYPSVNSNVKEIIHCGQCKWYELFSKDECGRSGGLTFYPLCEDHYCSVAEEKDS